jgi:pSer/pThr/pTyr-binding forkhead associated (FHA) protein
MKVGSSMPYCTNCGQDNPDGSNFCSRCGTPLSPTTRLEPVDRPMSDTTRTIQVNEERDAEALTAEDEAAVHALPHGSALLIVQRGSNAGSRFLLNTDLVTAGRHQSSDIFLDDISVSRRHATFTRTADGIVLKDSGSLNGTYVNRELVDQRMLRHGDEVQIGKFRLVFFASPQGMD